jgi:hypothetical protein
MPSHLRVSSQRVHQRPVPGVPDTDAAVHDGSQDEPVVKRPDNHVHASGGGQGVAWEAPDRGHGRLRDLERVGLDPARHLTLKESEGGKCRDRESGQKKGTGVGQGVHGTLDRGWGFLVPRAGGPVCLVDIDLQERDRSFVNVPFYNFCAI